MVLKHPSLFACNARWTLNSYGTLRVSNGGCHEDKMYGLVQKRGQWGASHQHKDNGGRHRVFVPVFLGGADAPHCPRFLTMGGV